jgi:hypothetical protein
MNERYEVVNRGKGVWYVLDVKENRLGVTFKTKRAATAIAAEKNAR